MRIGSQPLNANAPATGGKSAGAADALATSPLVDTRDGLTLSGTGKAPAEKDEPTGFIERLIDKVEHFFGLDEPDAPVQPEAPAQPAPAPAPEPVAVKPAPAPGAPTDAAAEMRRQAEAIWFKPANMGASSFRTGLRDGADVNAPDAEADYKADKLVKANAALENQLVGQLTPEQQSEYNVVVNTCAASPQSRLALQMLLAEGKLTGGARNADGDDLLGALYAMRASAGDVNPAIDLGSVMNGVLREIATPSAINQQDKTTCTVTSVQMLTAMENPAEYVRIATGLASTDGAVRLANGETLQREPGTEADDGSGRSTSSRLWQAAFSQFAVGPNVDFDNDKDARNDGKWGIFGPELDRVVDALTNRDNPLLQVGDGYTGEDLLRDVKAHANAGKPVPVCLDWGDANAAGDKHAGHDILVTKVQAGQVYYHNPWGTEESMSAAEFAKRAWWANPIDVSTTTAAAIGD